MEKVCSGLVIIKIQDDPYQKNIANSGRRRDIGFESGKIRGIPHEKWKISSQDMELLGKSGRRFVMMRQPLEEAHLRTNRFSLIFIVIARVRLAGPWQSHNNIDCFSRRWRDRNDIR